MNMSMKTYEPAAGARTHEPAERAPALVLRELGDIPGVDAVHGVSYDGECIWAAIGTALVALDPQSGEVRSTLSGAADAGTAFDGKYLYQIVDSRIDKLDPRTGDVVASVPAPAAGCSGLAWAEGSLWIGEYRGRKIHQLEPETGRVLRTLESNRFVTGVTWVDDELWHGTWDDERSELRNVDATTGEVKRSLSMPTGNVVSGLEAGPDVFYCGGGSSGKVRVVARPR